MADNIEILIKARQEATDAIDEIVRSVRALEKELTGIEGGSFSEVDKSADKAADSMGELADATEDAKKAAKGLEDTEGPEGLEEDARDAEEELRKLRDTLGEVQEAAVLLAASGAAVLTFFGTASKSAAEFGLQIAEISTLVDSTVVSNQELAAAVTEVSTAYGVDTARSAKALYDIISSGAQAGDEANRVLAASAKLATAGVADIGLAADGVTTILNSFGDSAGTAEDVVDKLFKTVEGGKTTVAELSRDIAQAAPIAASFGVSYDEVLASIVASTKQGVRTNQAFTGLRQLLVSLAKPTDELALAFQDIAGESAETVLATQGLGAALAVVEEASGGSQEAVSRLLGSVEALQGFTTITANEMQFFNEGLQSVENSAGSAQTALEKIQAEPLQQLSIAGQELATAFRDIGQLVLPLVSDLVGLLGDLARGVSEFVDENETFSKVVAIAVVVFASLLAVVGSVTLAVVTLRKAKLTLITALQGENAALATQNGLLARNATLMGATAGSSRAMATATGAITTSLKGMVAGAIRLVPALAAVWGIMKLFEGYEAFAEQEEDLRNFQIAFGSARAVIDDFNTTREGTERALADQSVNSLNQASERLREQIKVIQDAREAFAEAQAKRSVLGLDVGNSVDAARGQQLQEQFDLLFEQLEKVEAARKKALDADGSESTGLAKQFQFTKESAELLADNMAALNQIKFNQVNGQIDQLKSKLADIQVLGGSDQDAARIEEQIRALTVDTARQRADELTAIAEQEALEKRRIAERTIANEKERANELRDVALQLADDRLQIQQSYEAELASSLDAAVARQRQAAQDIRSLESQIADERKAGAEQLRSIQGKELSEYQQYVQLQKEISKAREDAAQAEEIGDLTALEEAGRRQRELADQLAELQSVRFDSGREYLNEEQTIAQATRVSKEATDSIITALERRKQLAEETRESSEEEITTLRENLSAVRAEISKLAEQKVELPVEVDLDALTGIFDSVEASLRERKFAIGLQVSDTESEVNAIFEKLGQDQLVTIKPQSEELDSKINQIEETLNKEYVVRIRYNELNRPQGFAGGGQITVPGFAGGGRIVGPGTPTSDSILIAASRDEFMMRNAAVKKYGLDFMYALNNLQLPSLPGFATGGSIAQGPANISSGSEGGDTVELKLDLGSGPIRLFGEREETRKLAKSLQRIKRGS